MLFATSMYLDFLIEPQAILAKYIWGHFNFLRYTWILALVDYCRPVCVICFASLFEVYTHHFKKWDQLRKNKKASAAPLFFNSNVNVGLLSTRKKVANLWKLAAQLERTRTTVPRVHFSRPLSKENISDQFSWFERGNDSILVIIIET